MISIIIVVKTDRAVENTLKYLTRIKKPEKTEILVIDASEGYLDDIKKKFQKVRWIYFHNKKDKQITISEQRNLGLKEARGDLIVFIDSNCIPKNNWLYELIKPIREEGENIVVGLTKSYKNTIHNNPEKRKYTEKSPTGNLAFRKMILKDVGCFDENFEAGEDIDFGWRAIKKGYKLRFNNKAIIYHDWGNIIKEIKRGMRYGAAEMNLYKKHPDKISNVFSYNNGMFSVYSIIFFIYIISLIPVSFFWPWYSIFLLIPFIKSIKNKPIRKLIFDFFWGYGVLKRLFELIILKRK
jgi:GT2 family glycosyltransferase